MKLYRVTEKRTSSYQGAGQSFWSESVLYCGWDRDVARKTYHEEKLPETGLHPGNPAKLIKLTIIEDAGTDDFDDDNEEGQEV